MAVLPILTHLCAVFALNMAAEIPTDDDAGETEDQLSELPELKVEEKRAACQNEWKVHGNRCFKLFNSKKTWSEAEDECVKQGGHLASIHNSDEAVFVGNWLGQRSGTWLGGGGDARSFRWYWTDSTAFDYSNWRAWEPNNGRGNEHCIQTNYRDAGVWEDLPCHTKYQFLCAKPN